MKKIFQLSLFLFCITLSAAPSCHELFQLSPKAISELIQSLEKQGDDLGLSRWREAGNFDQGNERSNSHDKAIRWLNSYIEISKRLLENKLTFSQMKRFISLPFHYLTRSEVHGGNDEIERRLLQTQSIIVPAFLAQTSTPLEWMVLALYPVHDAAEYEYARASNMLNGFPHYLSLDPEMMMMRRLMWAYKILKNNWKPLVETLGGEKNFIQKYGHILELGSNLLGSGSGVFLLRNHSSLHIFLKDSAALNRYDSPEELLEILDNLIDFDSDSSIRFTTSDQAKDDIFIEAVKGLDMKTRHQEQGRVLGDIDPSSRTEISAVERVEVILFGNKVLESRNAVFYNYLPLLLYYTERTSRGNSLTLVPNSTMYEHRDDFEENLNLLIRSPSYLRESGLVFEYKKTEQDDGTLVYLFYLKKAVAPPAPRSRLVDLIDMVKRYFVGLTP